jgi:hypothetical protein
MKYAYICYANLNPEWFEKMDELPAEMDRYKEHAEKHGFQMKYWGHPYGISENIVSVFKSEKELGEWQKMNQAFTAPYTGSRTILAARR